MIIKNKKLKQDEFSMNYLLVYIKNKIAENFCICSIAYDFHDMQ